MTKLLRTVDGWALDMSQTPEAGSIRDLFCTTTLPLPLGPATDEAQAMAFAEQTAFGLEYGVSL